MGRVHELSLGHHSHTERTRQLKRDSKSFCTYMLPFTASEWRGPPIVNKRRGRALRTGRKKYFLMVAFRCRRPASASPHGLLAPGGRGMQRDFPSRPARPTRILPKRLPKSGRPDSGPFVPNSVLSLRDVAADEPGAAIPHPTIGNRGRRNEQLTFARFSLFILSPWADFEIRIANITLCRSRPG